jgi:hypothetical protein
MKKITLLFIPNVPLAMKKINWVLIALLTVMNMGVTQAQSVQTDNLSKWMLSPEPQKADPKIRAASATEATSISLGDGFYLLDDATDPLSTLVELKISSEQKNRLITEETHGAELKAISKAVYTKFNDDFDFLFFVLDTVETEEILDELGFYGINYRISNNVDGIGISPAFNNTVSWGSSGKLKSAMYFPMYNAIQSGPTLHELAHNWAAFICPTFNSSDSLYSGHWGVSNAGGQLGGFKYVRTLEVNSGGVAGKTKYQGSMVPDFSRGFGEFANGGNGLKYSDIELYLMGMKSAQQLRDANFHLDIYTGNSDISINLSPYDGCFYSTGVTSYTIDNLITLQGERVPDAAASQKSFKILTVVLSCGTSHYEEIATAVAWMAGNTTDNTYGSNLYNFAQATNGVGSLEVEGIKSSLIAQTVLGNLTVSTGTLTPVFNPYTLSYTVNLPQDVTSITLTATKENDAQTVTGDGAKTLHPGTNNFDIEVTVGVTKTTYTIKVVCENDVCSAPNNVFPWILRFESGIPSCFTLINGYSGWQIGSDMTNFPYWHIPAHDGNYAYINDDVYGNQNNSNVWMKLPALDFTELTKPTLQFDNYRDKNGVRSIYTIKISTDGVVWDNIQTYNNSTSWQTETISLTSYEGEATVYIAFHYNDDTDWANGWAVDNINIYSATNTGTEKTGTSVEKIYIDSQKNAIQVVSTDPIQQVLLYNMQGELLHRNSSLKVGEYRIDGIATGIYLVKVTTDKEVQTLKVVVK